MRLTIVSSRFPAAIPIAPPILEYMAALTLLHDPGAEIRLLDANRRAPASADLDVDLLAISVMTVSADHSYALADLARSMGVRVVLGGPHPSVLPDEASLHADAVVVGEAESVWAQVLSDVQSGAIRPIYRGSRLSLDGQPMPAMGTLPGSYPLRAIFTARGCPQACRFCSVSGLFGTQVRQRPIEDVCRDVEHGVGRLYYNGDDNIWGVDTERSIALFTELAKGTRKWWLGMGDLASVMRPRGEELVRAARECGLRSVMVGYESDTVQTLEHYHALGKQGSDRNLAIRRIQEQGIEVGYFYVLGGPDDTPDDFRRALENADRMRVTLHPVMLTPYPGTELYEELRDRLLPGVPWGHYDGEHAVFEHPTMGVEQRECLLLDLQTEAFRLRRIARRVTAIDRRGFPVAHGVSLSRQLAIRRGFRRARERAGTNAGASALVRCAQPKGE